MWSGLAWMLGSLVPVLIKLCLVELHHQPVKPPSIHLHRWVRAGPPPFSPFSFHQIDRLLTFASAFWRNKIKLLKQTHFSENSNWSTNLLEFTPSFSNCCTENINAARILYLWIARVVKKLKSANSFNLSGFYGDSNEQRSISLIFLINENVMWIFLTLFNTKTLYLWPIIIFH